MIYIGIDPGKHTGVAFYESDKKWLFGHFTRDFWETERIIREFIGDDDASDFCAVIENPALNKGIYSRYNKAIKGAKNPKGVENSIRAGVAKNSRDAQLWIEYFKRLGIKVIEFKPNGKSPKWSEEYCKKITGEIVESEHSRDAIKMIFGL